MATEVRGLCRHAIRLLLSGAFAIAGVTAIAADASRGKEINGVCAGCHGDYGQGGKRGEYPRLAGQQTRYLTEQLRAFRARTRSNIPMFPYTQERELPDQDIEDVAEYLSSIELPTTPPDFKDSDDALTRLLAMEKVMIIPRSEGNLENGRRIYREECLACHRDTGRGRGRFPMLVGQYTNYLMRQVASYLAKDRPHDGKELEGVLNTLSTEDVRDVMAYLTALQYGDTAPSGRVAADH